MYNHCKSIYAYIALEPKSRAFLYSIFYSLALLGSDSRFLNCLK